MYSQLPGRRWGVAYSMAAVIPFWLMPWYSRWFRRRKSTTSADRKMASLAFPSVHLLSQASYRAVLLLAAPYARRCLLGAE